MKKPKTIFVTAPVKSEFKYPTFFTTFEGAKKEAITMTKNFLGDMYTITEQQLDTGYAGVVNRWYVALGVVKKEETHQGDYA